MKAPKWLQKLLESDTYPFNCSACGHNVDVTVTWEAETGDFGTILSHYPVFDVEPECSFEPSEDEWSPQHCPFSIEDSDDYYCHPQLELILRQRERRRLCNQLLGREL